MRRQSQYVIAGAGVAAAMVSFVVSLEVETTIARPRVEPTVTERMLIDRTLKGDRLPSVPRPSVAPIPQPKALEGCESSVSSINNPRAREIVGRCLAAAPAWRSTTQLG
jgi:hypothetical protein